MMPNYNTWIMHSEKYACNPDAGTSSNHPTAGRSTEQDDDMHAMLRDAFSMRRIREDICDPEAAVQGVKKQLKVTH